MATVRTDRESYWTLRVAGDVTGKTVDRTLRYMNPGLTDAKALEYGTALAGLQTRTLDSVHRTDKAVLENE